MCVVVVEKAWQWVAQVGGDVEHSVGGGSAGGAGSGIGASCAGVLASSAVVEGSIGIVASRTSGSAQHGDWVRVRSSGWAAVVVSDGTVSIAAITIECVVVIALL